MQEAAASCRRPPELTAAPLLLPQGLAALPASLQDLLDTLAQVADALRLSNTRPASLAAASLQAAADAQAAMDQEEAAFEAGRRLEAHIAATQRALGELQQLAEQLEAEGQQRDEAAARHRAALESNGGREARYVAQAAAVEAALRGAGFDPELSQARLQARGREHARVSAELAQARRELEQYGGLPADEDAARAATQQKRAELGRLRARLQEQLDTMA